MQENDAITSKANVKANNVVKPKFVLASTVLVASFFVIVMLGGYALYAANAISEDKDRMAAVQNILSIFLPMFGTWVGTIIAFYFSKENFEAASKSTQQLTKDLSDTLTPKQVLEATLVKDAMLLIDNVSTLVRTETDSNILIKKHILDGVLIKNKRNRLPVIDEKGHIIYMLHRSILEQFIVKRLAEAADLPSGESLALLTLADFVADAELTHFAVDSFITVKQTTTLAEVKTLMDHLPCCSDIFITEDGSKNTRVIGWITNNIILTKANV